jgi:hypothetical protein
MHAGPEIKWSRQGNVPWDVAIGIAVALPSPWIIAGFVIRMIPIGFAGGFDRTDNI